MAFSLKFHSATDFRALFGQWNHFGSQTEKHDNNWIPSCLLWKIIKANERNNGKKQLDEKRERETECVWERESERESKRTPQKNDEHTKKAKWNWTKRHKRAKMIYERIVAKCVFALVPRAHTYTPWTLQCNRNAETKASELVNRWSEQGQSVSRHDSKKRTVRLSAVHVLACV